MAEAPARIVFMGTPDFAASIMARVLDWPSGKVVGAYTQPDRPSGRGNRIVFSPVKTLALEHGIEVFQPATFRGDDAVEQLEALKPDFLLVAAYGLILPQRVLDIPKYPPLNVHGSILPRYRGAAPIQRAIMENWEPGAESGVSIMRMEAALDSGPVFAIAKEPIGRHTGGSLHDALATLGGDALCAVMDDLLSGKAQSEAQDNDAATYAAKLTKDDGQILWDRPVLAVDAHVRGVTPWPGAQVVFSFSERQEPIMARVLPGVPADRCPEAVAPGTLSLAVDGSLRIACADCWYVLDQVRPQGRKDMASADFVRGLRLASGSEIIGTIGNFPCHAQ